MSKLNATKKSNQVAGPVRTIGVQSRSITGTMPDGNRYESALERDFMLLLMFDSSVDVYTPQPLTLRYQGRDGEWHRYTPDGLIEWRQDSKTDDPRPLLVEIKYRDAFAGDWRSWRRQIRAIKNIAQGKGWRFEVFTERDIRTPFLENARFLLPYLRRECSPKNEQMILEKLAELVESTPKDLIEHLSEDTLEQANLIPVIWRLLGERRIGCDLLVPFTMQSGLWSLGEQE